jgi:hypothetical protein
MKRHNEIQEGYVKIAKEKCKICTQDFESNSLLVHTQLRTIKEEQTLIGWGICPTCDQFTTDGYVTIIGIDETKSKLVNNEISFENAHRTGEICRIKEHVFNEIFDTPAPEGKIIFSNHEVIQYLVALQ